MRKLLAHFTLVGMLFLSSTSVMFAQGGADSTGANTNTTPATTSEPAPVAAADTIKEKSFHQQVKTYFIEGGYEFMALVMICLILGLAIAIERIIFLNLSGTNTQKLLGRVDGAIRAGGYEKAIQVCKQTSGPVATVFVEGLSRADEGIEVVEKSIISYGGVEVAKLEKGLTWLNLFIALAPMLGFLGTVIGMIQAFDAIAAAGDISPNIVAGGMKVALITTVGGLIVAIILQILYNYIAAKVESISNNLEEASIELVDLMVRHGKKG